jgi:hypothetical protein
MNLAEALVVQGFVLDRNAAFLLTLGIDLVIISMFF